MSNRKLQIYKVIDGAENFYTKKDKIFDIPFRLLIVGKSQLSGKSNLLVNLLLRDEFYNLDFKPEDIYLVSPSATTDDKLIKFIQVKDIPESNIMDNFDEDVIAELYKMLEEEYEDDVKEKVKPSNKLLVLDDMSFGGALKKKSNGILAKIFSNGRHINLSIIVTAQKYTDIATSARENCSGAIFFNCSTKQLELISADHNYANKKQAFINSFRRVMSDRHSFFVVNYSNPKESRYMDTNFEPIEIVE
jgi:hypothetical protein